MRQPRIDLPNDQAQNIAPAAEVNHPGHAEQRLEPFLLDVRGYQVEPSFEGTPALTIELFVPMTLDDLRGFDQGARPRAHAGSRFR